MDTDTCVELLRDNPRVIKAREPCDGPVVTSVITAAELYYGAARSAQPERNRKRVTRFLESIDLMGFDIRSAQVFGEIKQNLCARGQGLADSDLLIAATALAIGAILVTGNRRHYERIPGLQIEDWIR